jgi:hypothetical protein
MNMTVVRTLIAALLASAAACCWGAAAAPPRRPASMIVYSASPNAYFNDHAADIKRFADGFFFVTGDWSEASKHLAPGVPWVDDVRKNVAALRKAGVDKNLLGVYISGDGPWPSVQQLLTDAGMARIKSEYGALGRAAKQLGFHGVSVDVEYAERRYEIHHAQWKYENYTPEDLTRAAFKQGEAAAAAILDEFPDAPIFVLPGELYRFRTLGSQFLRGLLA